METYISLELTLLMVKDNKYHKKSPVFAVLAVAMVSTFLSNCVAFAVFLLTPAACTVAGHRTHPFEVVLDVQGILSVFATYTNALFVAWSSILVTKTVLLPTVRPGAPTKKYFCIQIFFFVCFHFLLLRTCFLILLTFLSTFEGRRKEDSWVLDRIPVDGWVGKKGKVGNTDIIGQRWESGIPIDVSGLVGSCSWGVRCQLVDVHGIWWVNNISNKIKFDLNQFK